MSRYYPVLLDIRGRAAVVVGGNDVAAEKAAALAACGALVTVISAEFCEALQAQAERGAVRLCQRPATPDDLAGAFVVIAASNDPNLIETIWSAAQHNGQLVNSVDQPERCSFILPSILRRGPLTIAVSTEGTSPSLAKRIRQQLEQRFSAAYEPYLRLAAAARARLRAGGVPYQARDEFFSEFFASDALLRLEQQNWLAAAETTARLLQRYHIEVKATELVKEANDVL